METRTVKLFLAGLALFCTQALGQNLDDLFKSITATPTSTSSAPATPETTPGKLGYIDDDGVYHPYDPSVQALYDSRDFKSFWDYSLSGRGTEMGFSYELVDYSYRLPNGARREMRRQDRKFEALCLTMTPEDQVIARKTHAKDRKRYAHKHRQAVRIPLTVDVALDGDRMGMHFGTKFTNNFLFKALKVGPFLGVKYNFEYKEWERSLGLQILKFGF